MFDTPKQFQFRFDICCNNENYWELAYRLKLDPWFYLTYLDKEEEEPYQELLLLPEPRQLEKFILRCGVEAQSIYLLSPSFVNKSQDWKLHKILKITKATSKLHGGLIIKCVLEGNYEYTDGLAAEENVSLLKFETVYSV